MMLRKHIILQNKFENVSTIAKDSCFHFHYLGTKEKRNYDNQVEIEENVPIEKHFDFRLNGSFDQDNNYSSIEIYLMLLLCLEMRSTHKMIATQIS